jgi:hypothetical protein
MVRRILVHHYTNDLGTRSSSYILQYYGVAEVVGWHTWNCGLEGGCVLFLFNCWNGWVCQVDWKYQAPWNGIVEVHYGANYHFIHITFS